MSRFHVFSRSQGAIKTTRFIKKEIDKLELNLIHHRLFYWQIMRNTNTLELINFHEGKIYLK